MNMPKIILSFLCISLIDVSISSSFYNMPDLQSNATWNTTGVRFPYTTEDLPHPRSLFVDRNDTVYISFTDQGVVGVWYKGNTTASEIYHGDQPVSNFSSFLDILVEFYNQWLDWLSSFWFPIDPTDSTIPNFDIANSLVAAANGDLYVADANNNRIIKWTTNSSSTGISLSRAGKCYGLTIDVNDTLYCSLKDQSKIMKRSLRSNDTWETVIENPWWALSPKKLEKPYGIFIDDCFNLYVADSVLNSVVMFALTSEDPKTAKHTTSTINSLSLDHPTSVALDASKNLYIVDAKNHRIVFVAADWRSSRCLIGCSCKPGSGDNQLRYPIGIGFDSIGNILVSDTGNNFVRKFTLIQKSTDSSSTETSTMMPSRNTTENTATSVSGHPSTDSGPATLSDTGSTISKTSSQTNTTNSTSTGTSRPHSFIAPSCNNTDYFGTYCNISLKPCDWPSLCRNSGTCVSDRNVTDGFRCVCPPDYNGTYCEIYEGPCKAHICLNNGTCVRLNGSHFSCGCPEERTGRHCETLIQLCDTVQCLNGGVCLPSALNYTCQCTSSSYSGRHCEHVANSLIVRQYVSKAFGFVAILAISTVFGFVIIMDILKYFFGIDPVRHERELLRKEKELLKRSSMKTNDQRTDSKC